ncbi:hypothetical protein DUI87_21577 [Hirundo rustica rustica]|uniref:Reverse transcriptase thumb domain-containing protein n=1 Tax=Hirundo rustica rustica TaxID=333673 RepID=A0A3M0K5P7_HIRRU|nr:hypothetical protein DUI87_21577 [Hirundo rustica rustica]
MSVWYDAIPRRWTPLDFLGGLQICVDDMGQEAHSEVLPPLQAVTDREEEMEVDVEEERDEEMEVDGEENAEEEMEVDMEDDKEEAMEMDIEIDPQEDMGVDGEEAGDEEMEVDVEECTADLAGLSGRSVVLTGRRSGHFPCSISRQAGNVGAASAVVSLRGERWCCHHCRLNERGKPGLPRAVVLQRGKICGCPSPVLPPTGLSAPGVDPVVEPKPFPLDKSQENMRSCLSQLGDWDQVPDPGFELQQEKVQRMPPWRFLGLEITSRIIRPQKLVIKEDPRTLVDLQRLYGSLNWVRP